MITSKEHMYIVLSCVEIRDYGKSDTLEQLSYSVRNHGANINSLVEMLKMVDDYR